MAIDKDAAEKTELEERLSSVIGEILAVYLAAYREALRSGQPIPGADFSIQDLEYSLERHYQITQRVFRTRAFTNFDPVEFEATASANYQRMLDEWRAEVSKERAALISATNLVQGEDAERQAREALAAEQGDFSSLELSILAGTLLARKFSSRQKIIAETETLAAAESTKDLKAEALINDAVLVRAYGVIRTWNCSFRNSRDSHIGANGQRQPAKVPFKVGSSTLNYPGDPSAPAAEIVNCHCWLSSTVIIL